MQGFFFFFEGAVTEQLLIFQVNWTSCLQLELFHNNCEFYILLLTY